MAFGLLEEDLVIMVDAMSYPPEGARWLLPCVADRSRGHSMSSSENIIVVLLPRLLLPSRSRPRSVTSPAIISPACACSAQFYRNVPLLFRGFELKRAAPSRRWRRVSVWRRRGSRSGMRRWWNFLKLRTTRDDFETPAPVGCAVPRLSAARVLRVPAAAFLVAALVAGFLPVYEYDRTRLVDVSSRSSPRVR